jgi:uncharacterized integral membrane protein
MIMQFFLFLALLIAALAILFAAQNNDSTIVSFLFWEIQSSTAFVLVVSVLAGALISFFVSLPSNLKMRWTLRNQKKKISELETSLQAQKTRLAELEAPLAPRPPLIETEELLVSPDEDEFHEGNDFIANSKS